jgi:hypothetical protein
VEDVAAGEAENAFEIERAEDLPPERMWIVKNSSRVLALERSTDPCRRAPGDGGGPVTGRAEARRSGIDPDRPLGLDG